MRANYKPPRVFPDCQMLGLASSTSVSKAVCKFEQMRAKLRVGPLYRVSSVSQDASGMLKLQ